MYSTGAFDITGGSASSIKTDGANITVDAGSGDVIITASDVKITAQSIPHSTLNSAVPAHRFIEHTAGSGNAANNHIIAAFQTRKNNWNTGTGAGIRLQHIDGANDNVQSAKSVSYTHLTLPTKA